MTGIRKWPLAAAAIMAMLVLAGAAQADTVNSFLRFDGVTNKASDNNAEYLLVDNNRSGFLDIGDVIVGAFDINSLNDTGANLGGATGNHQWSGVFALEVKDLRNFTNAGTAIERADIIFGVYDDFDLYLDSLNGGSGPSDNPAVPTGTIARFWTNSTSTSNFDTNIGGGAADPDDNVATAATGSYYWDLGFGDESSASHWDATANGGAGGIVSSNGEGWVALNGGTNIAALTGVDSGTTLGTGNFGVSILGNSLGPIVIESTWSIFNAGVIGATAGQKVDVIGSSTVRGSDGVEEVAGFQASSDTNFTFLAVPLPTAAWPGIALLLGMGIARMRRRKVEA